MKICFRTVLACLFTIFYCAYADPAIGQNLIPDPKFLANSDMSCVWPPELFQYADEWYSLQGSPDWFDAECPRNNSQESFWSGEEGVGYAGMVSFLYNSSFFGSEGIGTQLLEPLQQDRFYYLEIRVRNKGFFHPDREKQQSCPTNPEKYISIFTGTDSLYFSITDNGELLGTNTTLWHQFTGYFLSEERRSGWTKLATCLEAPPNATHLGISPPIGSFTIAPPCMPIPTTQFYHIFYWDVGEVQLNILPLALENQVRFCEDEKQKVIQVDTLYDFQELDVVYRWEDGMEGSTRSINTPGTYHLDAILECTSIPIEIEVVFDRCEPEVFVPNAFSPNSDGFNDTFHPFIGPAIYGQTNYEFRVFDRWGNEVFFSNNPQDGWEGSYSGRQATTGIYVWLLQFDIITDKGVRKHKSTGDVLLVR